jgi:hypothetical protein
VPLSAASAAAQAGSGEAVADSTKVDSPAASPLARKSARVVCDGDDPDASKAVVDTKKVAADPPVIWLGAKLDASDAREAQMRVNRKFMVSAFNYEQLR